MTSAASATFTPLLDLRLQLGESPVWDEVEQALYFVDITRPALYRYDWRTKSLRDWRMPESIGSMGLRQGGGAVVALRTGVHLFDFATGRLDRIAQPEPYSQATRLNDGKVGPDGRFWVGSMDDRDIAVKEPLGAFYRIDADGGCTRMFDDVIVSNGLAWSPDGRTLYHSDSRRFALHAYDFDAVTGTIGNRRLVRAFDAATGAPDGATVDAEGFYWSAGVRGGRLNRVAPDGTMARWFTTPMKYPTMPCFCGPDLRTLVLTSLDRQEPQDHAAGTLIAMRVEVPGLPADRFAG